MNDLNAKIIETHVWILSFGLRIVCIEAIFLTNYLQISD